MPGADDMTVTVEIHEEDGSFWATVQEMPGVFASGESMVELEEALAEAIGMYVAAPGESQAGGSLTRLTQQVTYHRELAHS